MTNINNIQSITQILDSQSTKVSQASGNGFESVLNSAQEKIQAPEEGAKINELDEISAPAFDIQTVSAVVTDKTDKLLTKLENYASQLDDAGIPLKDIKPILEKLDEEATSLSKEIPSLGEEDQELIDIANSTALTAKTEYLKFMRGDYL